MSLFNRRWGAPFLRGLIFIAGMVLAVTAGTRLLHAGERAALGQVAPLWELRNLQGDPVRLEDFRGKPVLVNFWAVWCPPCREEMPLLARLARERHDVAVLTVEVGDTGREVAAFLDANGLTLPVALDIQGTVAARYGVHGLPTTFFLDAQGAVRRIRIGALDEDALRRGVAAVGVNP